MEFERPRSGGAPAPSEATHDDPCTWFARALRRGFGAAKGRPPRADIAPARDRTLLCPSAPVELATLTIGRRQPGEPFSMIPGSPDGADRAVSADLTRHACECIAARCGNWRGHCCLGAAVTITARTEGCVIPAEPCGIADRCRWFQENGVLACAGCVFVLRIDEPAR